MAAYSNSKPSPSLFFLFLASVALTIPPLTTSRKFSPPATSYSIQIHPREALFKSPHSDYRSLVNARLSRDSARVDYLVSKLRRLSSNLTAAEALTVPVVSGFRQGIGEYFGSIGVGTPAREFNMIIDTGSDVIWLQCEPCEECYQQKEPIFDPSSSSTYRSLPCNSQQCRLLANPMCPNGDQCTYEVTYGGGSATTSGDYASETVSFGNSGGTLTGVALGCGYDNEGFASGNQIGAAGLIGLGRDKASLTTQLQARSFSYCLVNLDSSSSSTLEFNSGGLGPGSVSAPLIRNDKYTTFYYLGLDGMSVGGTKLSIPTSVFQIDNAGDGGVIVDSGTTITRLPAQAYDALRDAFVEKMAPEYERTQGAGPFDTCYRLGSPAPSMGVPTVSFVLASGKSWDLQEGNVLIQVDSAGTYCLAFAASEFPLGIIGNVQQQGTRVNFDLENSRIEFAPKKC